MKKFGLLLLSVSMYATGNQEAVEKGLRSPVTFENESIKTYTVNERLIHYNVPAISFALIENGEIAWAQAYGTTSSTTKEKISVNTVFQAASIAKPLTAFGVLRMKDDGIININADINQYLTSLTLPESSFTAKTKVTFKNLLDHTSGLTGGGYQGYLPGSQIPTDIQTFLGHAPAINQKAQLEYEPGTQVKYSGAGYTLAEIALADIFDENFEKVMNDWALSKLQMNFSSFSLNHPMQQSIQAAIGHDSNGRSVEGGWRLHPEQAAAGLWSTPSDLAKLAIEVSKAFDGKSKLLSKGSAQEMLKRVLPEQDLSGQFGGHPAMTFVIAGEGDEFLFKHGGGTMGYRCFMLMYPHTGKGAVFMTNSDSGFGVGLEMLRAASDHYNWPNYRVKTHKRRQVNNNEQTRLIGEYEFDSGWKVKIIAIDDADGLGVVFPNKDLYPLLGIEGDNNYVHAESGVEVSFDMSSNTPKLSLYGQIGVKK